MAPIDEQDTFYRYFNSSYQQEYYSSVCPHQRLLLIQLWYSVSTEEILVVYVS